MTRPEIDGTVYVGQDAANTVEFDLVDPAGRGGWDVCGVEEHGGNGERGHMLIVAEHERTTSLVGSGTIRFVISPIHLRNTQIYNLMTVLWIQTSFDNLRVRSPVYYRYLQ